MKIKSQKDFFAGLMFVAVGAAFAAGVLGTKFKIEFYKSGGFGIIDTNYAVGEAARMGPGYFPLVLGILLAVLGLAIVFESMVVETEDGEKIGSIAWRPLGFIVGANVAFGILLGGLPNIGIPAMGLIAAIYALTFIASLAGDTFNLKEVTILATILAVFSYIAFVWMLKLQFPVWPSFITG